MPFNEGNIVEVVKNTCSHNYKIGQKLELQKSILITEWFGSPVWCNSGEDNFGWLIIEEDFILAFTPAPGVNCAF